MAIQRHAVADCLKEYIAHPPIDDHRWRTAQRGMLEGTADAFEKGYMHVVGKIPTGGGKSHVLGAFSRSIFESRARLLRDARLNEEDQMLLGLNEDVEVVLLTSRGNLVHQLINGNGRNVHEKQAAEDESETMDDDEEIQMGDVRRWVHDVLPPEAIRIVTVGSGIRERRKDALLTVETYQGATPRRIQQMHKRRVAAVLCDESHNLTGTKGAIIREGFPAALRFGMSATPQGPNRNPFNIFEPVSRKTEKDSTLPAWQQQLVFAASLEDLIKNKELKQLRWIQADTEISLEGVSLNSNNDYDDEEIARIFSGNINALTSFIERVLTEPQPILELSGSMPLLKRRHIMFVKRVKLAEEIAAALNAATKLGIRAEFTSGEDTHEEFTRKQRDLASGKLQFLISCQKLREGFDVEEVDCVWPLWPHTKSWILEQEIGRGTRFIRERPNADCVLIDPVYQGDHHALSILDLFGTYQNLNGGLLAAPDERRELERKVISLLQQGHTMEQIRGREAVVLTSDERRKLDEWWGPYVPPSSPGPGKDIDRSKIDVTTVQLAEREDVRQRLVQQLPEHMRAAITNRYTPEQWTEMNKEEKLTIEIGGMKLRAICTLFGIEGNPFDHRAVHLALGRAIFGEHPSLVERACGAEELRTLIKDRYTAETWANLTSVERAELELDGIKLIAIARTFSVVGDPVKHRPTHLALGTAIFGQHPALVEHNLDQLRAAVVSKYTPEQWADLVGSDKRKIDILGLKEIALATVFGIEGNPLHHREAHLALGRAIFGEHPAFTMSGVQENIRSIIVATYTPRQWAAMTVKQRKDIKAGEKKLRAIGTCFGILGNPAIDLEAHIALGQAIWGKQWTEDVRA